MRLLLDTNRYRDLVEHHPAVVDRFRAAEAVWLSAVTIGELRAGFAGGKQRDLNDERLRVLLEVQGVGVVAIDETTAGVYAEVHHALKSAGTMIPSNDLWIASQAIQHNLELDTRDEHFRRVPGLRLVAD
ncbi:MAG: type II toxin-antitoxin system VapC family toxin [Lacipirellulaceae bacterium]